MLTRRVSTAQAVARLGPKKGGNGVGKDESYTSFSMLDDYNTLLQRKALFPSRSECSACVPAPNVSICINKASCSTTKKKEKRKSHTQDWDLHHEVTPSNFYISDAFAIFQTPLPPFCSSL